MRTKIYRIPTLVALLLFVAITNSFAGKPEDDLQNDSREAVQGSNEDGKPENSGIDEALAGFDDEDEKEPDRVESETGDKYKRWSITGSASMKSSYNYASNAPQTGQIDYSGLSRMRSEIDMKADVNLSEKWKAVVQGVGYYDSVYSINGRNDYTREVLHTYESEGELREAFVQGSLTRKMDTKIGRQIVVWGKSSNIRVTDILNPLDMREVGMVDIEDLRLPVTMIRGDYYWDKWSFSEIFIPEIRFNKNPAYGSDFYPASSVPPPEDTPESGFNNMEHAFALNGVFSGYDVSFYVARVFNDAYHFESDATYGFVRRHAKLTMLGAAGNVVRGDWLFIAEGAWFDGFKFYSQPGETRSRLDFLVGAEYSGITDTAISIEAVNRHMFGYEDALKDYPDQTKEDELQWAARLTRDFLHQTLKVTMLASAFGIGGEDGSYQRFQASYDVNDSLNITGGVMVYQPGEKAIFKAIADNDRIFLDAKYSF